MGLPSEEQISHLRPLRVFLKTITSQQSGLIGWAPGILPDADDTARVLMTINFLGDQVDFSPMVTSFRSHPCFKTYEMERNPSLSANCNVLLALITSESPAAYIEDIEIVLDYLLKLWKEGDLSDKWNISSHYSCMILSSALVTVLQLYIDSQLEGFSSTSMVRDIVLCLVQMLSRMLSQQGQEGSWDNSLEVTSYCALTLSQLLRLPFNQEFQDSQLRPALLRAQEYVKAHWNDPMKSDHHDYLWVEKVSYSSGLLRKVYAVAALNAKVDPLSFSADLSQYFTVSNDFDRIKTLLQSIPMFQTPTMVSWHLTLLEAALWTRYLQESKHDIYLPVEGQNTKDKHMSLIPVIWTACNSIGNHVLSPNTIWELIFISLLGYQTDEFMETSTTGLSKPALEELKQHLEYECKFTANAKAENQASLPKQTNCNHESYQSPPTSIGIVPPVLAEAEASIIQRLRIYINWLLGHPKVLESSQLMQRELASEIYHYLSGHIAHVASNAELSLTHCTINPDYPRWVGSVGADDTSCPLATLFFVCVISDSTKTAFEGSPLERYLSRSVIRHLAIMCRQYNDYGSVARDIDEDNLNSLHFPEFLSSNSEGKTMCVDGHGQVDYPSSSMKEQLLAIAEFEREQMELAFQRLEEASVEKRALASLRVYMNGTDLWGLIYLHRDYSNRLKHHPSN